MKKSALAAFRRLPGPVRRLLIHTAAPSFTVGAVAVLRRDDGRIAMVQQRHSVGWALPGGLLGRGETAAAGLVRELKEELGFDYDADDLPVPLASVNAAYRRVDLVFSLGAPAGARVQVEDRDEVTRVGWFALDALPELSEPTRDILTGVRLL
jgi:ADP-ribose pyrophosphatase YjhB (NUDIX family)